MRPQSDSSLIFVLVPKVDFTVNSKSIYYTQNVQKKKSIGFKTVNFFASRARPDHQVSHLLKYHHTLHQHKTLLHSAEKDDSGEGTSPPVSLSRWQ